MGAERSQWQFPANEVGKVIGWSDEASPSNPSASKGLVNKGPFVEPDDIANMVETTDTDASGFGFVIDEDDMASDSDTKIPTQQSVKAYVDGKSLGLTRPEDFGTITYGRGIAQADAIANREAIQDAIDSLASTGGVIFFRPGQVYECYRDDDEDHVFTVQNDNIYFLGRGACVARQWDNDRPKYFFDIGAQPVDSSVNGATQVRGGGFIGLELDGGLNVQKITNGKFYDGTTGWTLGVTTGTITAVGGSDAKRAMRVTVGAAASANGPTGYQAIPTVIGQEYYVRATVVGGTSSDWRVWAATSTGTGGVIVQKSEADFPTGACWFKFTATTATTYIACNTQSSTQGLYVDFRDIRVWEAHGEVSGSIINCRGIDNYLFEDFHFHDTHGYGIGFENGGHTSVKVINGLIEDTFMDGIDHKNNGSMCAGNSINGLTLRRCGLKDTVPNPAACVDLSTGWVVSNLSILEFGTATGGPVGLRFKQGDEDESRGIGGRYNSAAAVYIEADDTAQTDSICILLQNTFSQVADFTTRGGGYGVYCEQKANKATNGNVLNAKTTGISAVDSSYDTNADRTKLAQIHVEGCPTGVSLATDNNELDGVYMIGNGLNLSMAGNNNTVRGGEISGHTGSKPIDNDGTGNRLTEVSGFPTKARLESPTFLIDSTGLKTPITVPHGLQFTPPVTSIMAMLKRSAVNSGAVVAPRVTSTNSTDINLQAFVQTASGSAGDTATLIVHVDAEAIPAL